MAIKKQFLLRSLAVQRMAHAAAPATISLTFSSPLHTPTSLHGRPAAAQQPSNASQPSAAPDGGEGDQEGEWLATSERLRVFVEVQAAVPLVFAEAHKAYTTPAGTYIAQVCLQHLCQQQHMTSAAHICFPGPTPQATDITSRRDRHANPVPSPHLMKQKFSSFLHISSAAKPWTCVTASAAPHAVNMSACTGTPGRHSSARDVPCQRLDRPPVMPHTGP